MVIMTFFFKKNPVSVSWWFFCVKLMSFFRFPSLSRSFFWVQSVPRRSALLACAGAVSSSVVWSISEPHQRLFELPNLQQSMVSLASCEPANTTKSDAAEAVAARAEQLYGKNPRVRDIFELSVKDAMLYCPWIWQSIHAPLHVCSFLSFFLSL